MADITSNLSSMVLKDMRIYVFLYRNQKEKIKGTGTQLEGACENKLKRK